MYSHIEEELVSGRLDAPSHQGQRPRIVPRQLVENSVSMTDQNQSHPIQGRRRRHKSPASLPSVQNMVLPRLVDYLDNAGGPSDNEEEKDAKRQRSEPTTPRSTSSRPPHEYDEVMGITQVEPRDAERFEEGNDSEFQDAEEVTARETHIGDRIEAEDCGAGGIHGIRQCYFT